MSLIEKLPSVVRLKAENAELRRELNAARAELETARRRQRPARLVVDGNPDYVYEEMISGTESHPVMKGVVGLLNARIVEMSDTATERPSLPMSLAGGVTRGYSEEERLYDAGGCALLADFLARIQEAAKPKDPEESTAAT